jgi:hypothetical protein
VMGPECQHAEDEEVERSLQKGLASGGNIGFGWHRPESGWLQ